MKPPVYYIQAGVLNDKKEFTEKKSGSAVALWIQKDGGEPFVVLVTAQHILLSGNEGDPCAYYKEIRMWMPETGYHEKLTSKKIDLYVEISPPEGREFQHLRDFVFLKIPDDVGGIVPSPLLEDAACGKGLEDLTLIGFPGGFDCILRSNCVVRAREYRSWRWIDTIPASTIGILAPGFGVPSEGVSGGGAFHKGKLVGIYRGCFKNSEEHVLLPVSQLRAHLRAHLPSQYQIISRSGVPPLPDEEAISWIEQKISEGRTRVAIRGEAGSGKTVILFELKRKFDGPESSSSIYHCRPYILPCRTPVRKNAWFQFVSSLVTMVTGKAWEYNSIDGALEVIKAHFKLTPSILILDDFHVLCSRLKKTEAAQLKDLLSAGSGRCFVVASITTVDGASEGIPVEFLSHRVEWSDDQFRQLYHNLCGKLQFTSPLDDEKLSVLIEACKRLPKRLQDAVTMLYDRRHWSEILDKLENYSDESELDAMTHEEQVLAYALCLVCFPELDKVEKIVTHAAGSPNFNFDKTFEALQSRYPGLTRTDEKINVPEALKNHASQFEDSEVRASLEGALKTWAAELLVKLPEWRRNWEQYCQVNQQKEDLEHAASWGLDEGPTVLSEDQLIEIAEIVHHFGAWYLAEELMTELIKHCTGTRRVRLWLLLARHHSYRREIRQASTILRRASEEANAVGDSALVIQVRLRSGQICRHTDRDQGKRDLRYVMNEGSIYDYLVAAGFLVDLYIDEQEYESAREILETAMAIQENLPLPWERIRAHHHRLLGEVNALQGLWGAARYHFEEAEKKSQWAADQRLLGWAKLGRAFCSCNPADVGDALKNLTPLGKAAEEDIKRVTALERYISSIKERAPRAILFLGGPGGGKTTLRDKVLHWLVDQGIPAFPTGIEEAQRLLYPRVNVHDLAYEYDDAGALVISDRDALIPPAYKALSRLIEKPEHPAAVPLVEFTHRDLAFAFGELGSTITEGACVLFLDSSPAVRLERNNGRRGTPGHVSEEVVRDYAGTVGPLLEQELESRGAKVYVVGGEGSPGDVLKKAQGFIRAHFAEWFDNIQGIGERS